MGWVRKVPREHRCYPPQTVSESRWTGSLWKCHCGVTWEIFNVREGMGNDYVWCVYEGENS